MQTYLEDTRQLDERGDHQAALELVDLWLDEHPSDADARLLKAHICLNAAQDYAYVGQVLLDFAASDAPPLDGLRRRSAEFAWSLVAAGRDHLRSRHPDDALAAFENAAALLPTDEAIPLAIGLALVRIQPARDPNAPLSPFSETRRRLNPAELTAQIEKYLRRVIAGSAPESRPYEVAAAALVRHWQAAGRLTAEALALLARIPAPTPSTAELLVDLVERVRVLAFVTVANLLRIGLPDRAGALLDVCAHAGVVSARLALYDAERLADQPDAALAAYERTLVLAAQPERVLNADAARTILVAAQGVSVKCPHCGKATRPNAETCIFCETSLVQRTLLIDAYADDDAPDTALALAGSAEILLRRGERALALEQARAALDALPPDHGGRAALNALRERLVQIDTPPADSPADRVLRLFAARGIGAEGLLELRRVNENHPDSWRIVSLDDRVRLMRRLIDAGQLLAARQTLAAAFADQPGSRRVGHVAARLDKAISAKLDEALVAVRAAPAEEAVTLATSALDLRRDARLLRARGDARLAAGCDLAALEDYFAAAEDAERVPACKAAALVLERRWNLLAARSLLETLDPADPDVKRALARLDRRERGEPAVLTERIGEGVMDDTLTRRVQPPYYHGIFALVVREVGFAHEAGFADGDAWIDHVLAAGTEFVQVLGALRDVMGGAVFVLRTISRPHRSIPERGTVTVALLARVSASDEPECRARAVQLWTDIQTMLPLAQENVYAFEPVVDEDELHALLTPFELMHVAEITRADRDADGAHPFVSASADRHSLHWALLRQNAPAMISIHLKPTHLLPWERPAAPDAAFDAPLAEGEHFLSPGLERPNNVHLARVRLWEQLRQAQTHSFASAYLLRVYVAGGVGTSQLLPEMAAAALFEPLQAGSCFIARAGSPQEFDVIRRNLSALDVESWPHDGGRGARIRYLVGEIEAAGVFRLPIPSAEGVPGMTLLEGRPVLPPAGMPDSGTRLGVSVARVRGVPLPITQAEADRRRHLYLVGKTGMGKSTLMQSLILQDIEAGRGVFLLDPHGDLCDDVLARIPDYRRDDVILLDPSDAERPLGLNILDAESEVDRHRVVNEFIGLLVRMYDPHNQAIVGPIFQQSVRNAMLAAMSLPDGTLIDVYRILSDSEYVQGVLPHVQDPLVRSYWQGIAARVEGSASPQWKAEMLPYVLSKFSRFVEDATLRRMIGQPRSSIDWGGVMDEGKILLVNLAKGRIGAENSQFIGSLVLSSVLQAAFRRGALPAARRREFYLYIDEVQNYATPLLETMLSEGRKFGVILTIANQYLHQLDNGIREAVFGNVGSMVAFRVGAQDAPALAPEFFPVFSPADLLNLPQFTACVRLLVDGVAARPFTMRTLPAMTPADAERAAQIRDLSRQRYGTDISEVQREILKKF